MKSWKLLSGALGLLIAAVVFAGCSNDTRIPVKPPGQEQIKPALEDVAQNGQLHSGIMVVRTELEKMKQTDSAKAEALLADLKELESLKDSAKIKAKAKEMLGKL